MTLAATPASVRAAHAKIAAHVRRTPLMVADLGHAPRARGVSFKLEYLQHAGSFKTRGAYNNLLSRTVPAAGVAAASGGNHGVAVALACARLALRVRIFVPEISAPAKVAAIRAHGADVIIGGARYADAQAACDAYARESGALVVHPFDAPETMAGAGTVALEWDEDAACGDVARLGELDTVLVGVGGGGLAAGMACYWEGRVRVVGVEPEGSRCLHAALEAGRPVDVTVDSVAADSLGARRAGEHVFEAARTHMAGVVLVQDDAIVTAQRTLWRDYRIAAEPGGAAALGALISGAYVAGAGEHVGVLLCGANVGLDALAALTAVNTA